MLPSEPDIASFEARMDLLTRHFKVLPVLDAVRLLREGALPTRTVCVTFDDGYRNNIELALPILRARKIPATVFVAPGYTDGGAMFNDVVLESFRAADSPFDLESIGLGTHDLSTVSARASAAARTIDEIKHRDPCERNRLALAIARRAGLKSLPEPMMNRDEIRSLHAAGVSIGAHTMTHPILKNLANDEAAREIGESRRALEEILQAPVLEFAYPNGKPSQDYTREHVDAVRNSGFEIALTTSWGAALRASDPFQLPRIAPWDTHSLRYIARILLSCRSGGEVA